MANFFIKTFLFLIASTVFLVIPGSLIWQKSKLKGGIWEKLVFSTTIGFVSFTLLSYVLLYFKIDTLIIPITLAISIIWFTQNYSYIKKFNFFSPFRLNKKLLLILILFGFGILGQLAVISPSGIYLNRDLVFWSSHGHDASWHIALIEEIKRGSPWQNPVYAGEKLVNYHFFSDISLAIFNKYFNLNIVDLYFRLFPLVYSILLGGSVFYLTKLLTNSFSDAYWATFFTYFAGSFGYIVTFIQNKTIAGETVFGSSQVQSTIGNPPQITASFMLVSFLYFFALYLKNKKIHLFYILILLASTLIVFKVYAGVVVLSSLLFVGLWQTIREHKFGILLLSILSISISSILYLPNTANSASFLIWEPWWYIRTLVVYTNKLNWLDLELRRQTYLADRNYKRVISIELMSFLIFFFGNLGMRFLGLWDFTKLSLSFLKDYLHQLIILISLISFIMPMLFLQKGVAGNTIQFLQYFLLIFGILAGISFANLLSKIKIFTLKCTLIILLILLSIPTQVALILNFYLRPPVAKIEYQELQALNFLKNNSNKDSIILSPPFNKFIDLKVSTPPVWAWSDSAYVSAFSARRTYLADSEQVDIMGYDLKSRLNMETKIFSNIVDVQTMTEILKQLKINYIYFPKAQSPKLDLNRTTFKKIFDNGNIEIWKIS